MKKGDKVKFDGGNIVFTFLRSYQAYEAKSITEMMRKGKVYQVESKKVYKI